MRVGGSELGFTVGDNVVGLSVGFHVGLCEGRLVGVYEEGRKVGTMVGNPLGVIVGCFVSVDGVTVPTTGK